MKVYVMTKFAPLGKEEYIGVAKSEKDAMKKLREMFPYMRGSLKDRNLQTSKDSMTLLNVREEELD